MDIMSEQPPVISDNTNLLEVAHLMSKAPKRLLLVKDFSKMTGIISDQNIFMEIMSIMQG